MTLRDGLLNYRPKFHEQFFIHNVTKGRFVNHDSGDIMASHCRYDHHRIGQALPTILWLSNPRIGLSCRRLLHGSLVRSTTSISMIFLSATSYGCVLWSGSPLVIDPIERHFPFNVWWVWNHIFCIARATTVKCLWDGERAMAALSPGVGERIMFLLSSIKGERVWARIILKDLYRIAGICGDILKASGMSFSHRKVICVGTKLKDDLVTVLVLRWTGAVEDTLWWGFQWQLRWWTTIPSKQTHALTLQKDLWVNKL